MAARSALGTQTRKTGYKAATIQGEACMQRSGVKDIRTAVGRDMRQYGGPHSWLPATP
jgi:hypothetical protein